MPVAVLLVMGITARPWTTALLGPLCATSMLAESIHSVADTGNQGLLALGGRRARRVPDKEHPFGYGRERCFWAFLVAVVLFTVGGAFSLYEGVDKLRHPHELESPQWAIFARPKQNSELYVVNADGNGSGC